MQEELWLSWSLTRWRQGAISHCVQTWDAMPGVIQTDNPESQEAARSPIPAQSLLAAISGVTHQTLGLLKADLL